MKNTNVSKDGESLTIGRIQQLTDFMKQNAIQPGPDGNYWFTPDGKPCEVVDRKNYDALTIELAAAKNRIENLEQSHSAELDMRNRFQADLAEAERLLEIHARFCMCRRRLQDDDHGCSGRIFLERSNKKRD